MVDAHLMNGELEASRFDQNLRVDEVPRRLDLDPIEDRAAEELERAVDVANPQVEHRTHDQVVAERKEAAEGRILSVLPKADDDVVLCDVREQVLQACEIELAIRVGEEEVGMASRVEAVSERATVALVLRFANQPEVREALLQALHLDVGAVCRAVAHDDDLEVLDEVVEDRVRGEHAEANVLDLVERGDDDGEAAAPLLSCLHHAAFTGTGDAARSLDRQRHAPKASR